MTQISLDEAWAKRKHMTFADLHATAGPWFYEWGTCPYCNSDRADDTEYDFESNRPYQTILCCNCECRLELVFEFRRAVPNDDNAEAYAHYLKTQETTR